MNEAFSLLIERDRVRRLIRRGPRGRPREVIEPVWTVEDVCRRLRKSRRQVYRYLHTGRLQPCARVLGQWLFAREAVAWFQQDAVPNRLRPFFWDVKLAQLSRDRHRDFILARLLEFGDQDAVRWLFAHYQRGEIKVFLRRRGAKLLSKRTWHFWALQFGLTGGRTKASHRQRAWEWNR